MIKIVPPVKLRDPGKPADGGWRNSQAAALALGQAAGSQGEAPNVSDRDADMVAKMMGDDVQSEASPDVAYPAAKCGLNQTLINPDKETVAQMMIQNFIKRNGSIIMSDDNKPTKSSGPKLILG